MLPLLEARKISKSFTGAWGTVPVFSNLSLSLTSGQSMSIRGESGSGKTTLLNVLMGLESFEQGEVFWEGKALKTLHLREQALARCHFFGLIFQAYYLIPELNVIENVLFPARLVGNLNKEAKARAEFLLNEAGLRQRLHYLPEKLSGGERQRVAIARALINKPKLLLADEPTGNLDEKTAEVIIQLLFHLTKEEGLGLILVTHNADFARRTKSQALLHEGKLIFQ